MPTSKHKFRLKLIEALEHGTVPDGKCRENIDSRAIDSAMSKTARFMKNAVYGHINWDGWYEERGIVDAFFFYAEFEGKWHTFNRGGKK